MSILGVNWNRELENWLVFAYSSISEQYKFPYKNTNTKTLIEIIAISSLVTPNQFSQLSKYHLANHADIDNTVKVSGWNKENFLNELLVIGPGILYPLAHIFPLLLSMGDHPKYLLFNHFKGLMNLYLKEYGVRTFFSILPILNTPGFDTKFVNLLKLHKEFKQYTNHIDLLSGNSCLLVCTSLDEVIYKSFWHVVTDDPQILWKNTSARCKYNQHREDILNSLIHKCCSIFPNPESMTRNFIWSSCFNDKTNFDEVIAEINKSFLAPFNHQIISVINNNATRNTWQSYISEPVEFVLIDPLSNQVISEIRNALSSCSIKMQRKSPTHDSAKDITRAAERILQRTQNFRTE